MATIASTLKFIDKMTPALRSITTAINSTLRAMESMDAASSAAFEAARRDAGIAAAAIDNFSKEFEDIPERISRTTRHMDNMVSKAISLTAAVYGIRQAFDMGSRITKWADSMTQATARLTILNDMMSEKAISMDMSVSTQSAMANLAQLTEPIDASVSTAAAMADLSQLAEPIDINLSTVDAAAELARLTEPIAVTVDTQGALTDMSQLTQPMEISVSTQAALSSVEQLENAIFASAQRSRSDWLETMNAVSQFGINAGDAFSGTDEILAFTELVNKSFKISGAGAEAQTGAIRQLTQALASGVLRGDELNSIAEQAPIIYQAVADYMGKTKGEVRALAAEGQVSADIVKNAMFSAAGDIEERFAMIPTTFADHMTTLRNYATKAFEPVQEQLSEIAQSEKFQNFINDLSEGMFTAAQYASVALSIIGGIGGAIYDNWSVIGPVVGIAAAALGGYVTVLGIYSTAQAIANGLQAIAAAGSAIKAGASIAEAAATTIATGAQVGLNAALLACPITWIIVGIVALIAILFAVVAAINKTQDTSISAIGIVTGAVSVAGAFIDNLILGLIDLVFGFVEFFFNGLAAAGNFLENVFKDPVAAVGYLFLDLFNLVFGVLERIAGAVDGVLKTDFTSIVSGWSSSIEANLGAAIEERGNGQYEKIIGEMDLHKNFKEAGINLDKLNYSKAWDSGYSWGEEIGGKLSSIEEMIGGLGGIEDIPDYSQYGNHDGYIDEIDRVGSVGSIDDDVTIAEDDLKLMKDIAALEYQLNYTQLTPTATFGDTYIYNSEDADTIMEKITTMTEEALESCVVVSR